MDNFDPQNQTLYMLAPDAATEIPVWIPDVDSVVREAIAISINYAAQIGACFIMLLVVLTMTSPSRLWRPAALINAAALAVGVVRTTLLALYFTSSYLEFYTFFAQDYANISAGDTRISVAATFFALPQLVLIEAALILQASSMIQLWQPFWKWLAAGVSVVFALLAVGFKCASVSIQIRSIVDFFDPSPFVWVRQMDLVFSSITIFWFCFVFNARLVMHMVENRSILPSIKGLSAMEVLVMTNGILMLVPVIFAGLQFGTFQSFEPGSLTETSVIIALPLGTLVAQRLANAGTSFASRGLSNNTASSETGSSKKRFLANWSQNSSNGGDSSNTGVTSYIRRGGSGPASHREKVDPVDLELRRIDAEAVWIEQEIEVQRESRS